MEGLRESQWAHLGSGGTVRVRNSHITLRVLCKAITDENIYSGARGVLEAYWKKIGGKPVRPGKAATTVSTSKKRGRASTASETKTTPRKEPKERKDPVTKRQRQSLGRTPKEEKGVEAEADEASDDGEDDKTPEPVPGYIEVGSDDWRPPKPTAGAWDKHIQAVDTIEKDDAGKLWAYLLWTQQNADGYFYRNKAKLETCYVACPQRVSPLFMPRCFPSFTVTELTNQRYVPPNKQMLQFYEKHVVFTKYKAPN